MFRSRSCTRSPPAAWTWPITRWTTWRRRISHRFRYRVGAMIGLDREGRKVHVAATHDDAGCKVTPQRAFGYDTLVIAVGGRAMTSARRAWPSTR